MGISPAPEVFQRKLTQALEGLTGIYIIADDILITREGDTMRSAGEEHDRKLRLFLQRCREKNIKLNPEKFKLRKQSGVHWAPVDIRRTKGGSRAGTCHHRNATTHRREEGIEIGGDGKLPVKVL